MRKLTLLIVSLLCYVGVLHAQALVADGVYTLSADVNKQRGEMVAADGYEYPVLDGIDLGGYTGNSTAAMANGEYWYVQSVDASSNTYYIYNIAKGKYLVNEGGNVNFGDTPYVWTFVTNAGKPAYLNIKDESKTDKVWLSSGCGRTASQRPVQWDDNNNDGGALYTFTRISDYFATPATGKFYKIKGTHSANPWLTATVENGGIDVAANEAAAAVYLKTADGLKAISTGKYIGTGGNGEQISLVDAEHTVTIEKANACWVYIKTGGRYLYNNQPDYTREAGHLTAAGADAPKWGFIEVEAPAATVNGVLYETLQNAAKNVQPGQTLTLWKDTDETIVLPFGVILDRNGHTANNVTVATPVAKIGDQGYATLAAAITAAPAGATITFVDNINENVTLSKNVTIDGAGKTYTGTMSANNALTVTVQNVNFVNGGFSKNNDGTSGTYTIKDCTFDGQSKYAYPVLAKNIGTLNVENCTVKDYQYGFLYVKKQSTKVSVKSVSVENCANYAVYLASGVAATIENLNVKKSNNGILWTSAGARTLNLNGCKFENVKTAINSNGGAYVVTANVQGVNNDFGTAVLSDNVKCVLDENDTLAATTAGLNVTTNVEGKEVAYKDGVYSVVVKRDPTGYVAYRADVTDKGDREGIAILLKEVYAKNSLVVKVYNGETLMFTCTRRDIDDEGKVMFPVDGNTTANIVLWGKESGSWNNDIHVTPTELNVPDRIEIIADGVPVQNYTHESGTVLGTNLEKYLALECVKKFDAKIGNVGYETLAAAIEAAEAGATVELLNDVTASDIITINKAITLDGNDKTLTSTAGRAFNVETDGNVAIKNLTINASGERAINVINKPANVTIEGVTATAANYTVNVAATAGAAKVAITGSNLTGLNVVNVTASGAEVTINGGTITCNDQTGVECYAALNLTKDAKNGKIVADDVNFVINGDSKKASNGAEGGVITIDGETGEVDVIVAYISYGNTYYSFTTIEAAIAKANAGETVTLLRDITASAIITINKAITLDGNGKKLTSTAGRAINVETEGEVVIKNLTIDAKGERAINIINLPANVTVDNVTATAKNNAVMMATSAAGANLTVNKSNFTGLAVVNVASANSQVEINNTNITNVDANEGENYGAISIFKTATNATVVVNGGKVVVAADSKAASIGAAGATVTFNGTEGNTEVQTVVAYIGDAGYTTLEEAIKDAEADDVITLIRDVTMNYGAREAFATNANTVTIDGNGKVLTLNQKNSDWASIGLENNNKLVLKNMTIEKTGYGDTSGAWNTHAIIFSTAVEMENVTVNNSVAVQAGATLNNVTIKEANGYYGLWINGNGQAVTVNGGSITATNGGRGIKIADQYIDAPAKVTLNVTGTVFNTAKKAAVLVSSKAGAEITASNVNITNVAQDDVNFVWVDEDWSPYFAEVKVTGATMAQEGLENLVAQRSNGARYKTFAAAVEAAAAGETITLIADATEDAAVILTKNLKIDGAGHTFTGAIEFKSANGSFTVKNVNFNGPANSDRVYALKSQASTTSLTVEGCTATGYPYGFLYANKAVANLTVKNVTVENVNYGVHSAYGTKVTLENYKATDVKYPVYVQNYGTRNVVLKNCSFKGCEYPLSIWERNQTNNITFNFEGVNEMGKTEFCTGAMAVVNADAIVGTKVYATLAEAVAAAEAGDAVTLLRNVELSTFLTINKSITLNMGEYNITRNDGTALYVNGDVEVVIDGTTGKVTGAQALFVNNGLVEVNGGNFCGGAEAVYVTNTGKAEIYDGTFSSNNYNSFVLNKKDSDRGNTDITVYGGTFVGFNPADNAAEGNGTNFVAEGYVVVDNGDDTYTVEVNPAYGKVAKVGDNYYETLAAAVADAAANATVELIDNINEDVTLTKNVTIAGAEDKTYTGTMSANANITVNVLDLNFVNAGFSKSDKSTSGNYTFKGCTFDGKGTYSRAIYVRGANKVVLEDCTATGYDYFMYVPNALNNSITVKNVTVENCGGYAVFFNSGAGKAMFENFTVKNTTTAIVYNNSANRALTLNNCTMENVDTAIEHANGDKNITCTFVGVNDLGGAAFSEYVVLNNAALAGTVIYSSLAEAVAADGNEVKLLGNSTGAGVVIDEDLTIDFNEKTYTVNKAVGSNGTETLGLQLLGGDVVLKNGTLKSEGENIKMLVQNYTNLTVEDMHLDGCNLNGTGRYVLSNNSGDVVVEGKTNITAKDGDFAFDACKYANYEIPNVTVKTTGKITGKVEVTGGNLVIYSGTYTMDVNEWCAEGYSALKTGENLWTVTKTVAEVGKQMYGSIQAAIDAAQDGETVTLISNVKLTDEDIILVDGSMKTFCHVPADKNIAFNMNEKEITVSYTGEGYLYGVFLVDGGLTVTGNGKIDISQDDRKVAYMFLKRGAEGYLVVENGTFHAGNLEDSMIYTNATDVVTVKGGTFTIDKIGTRENGCPWIFNAKGANERYINVTGGTYNWDISRQYWVDEVNLADDKTVIETENGLWTVAEAEAAIDGRGYLTLAAAVEAAVEGETVTLLKDVTGAGLVINKSIAIDFNEKIYTVNKAVGSKGTETLGLQILKDNDVTLTNGTLTSTAVVEGKEVKMLVQNYANLTLEDMNLVDETEYIQYALSNNSGVTYLTGNTNITTDAVAFDSYYSTSYAAPTVNVETTGTITGAIEKNDGATIAISSGTFTVEILPAWCAEYHVPVKNDNGTWTVESRFIDELAIVDNGKYEYAYENDMTVGEFTYTRTFPAVNLWQTAYFPFEIPVEVLVNKGYEVGYFYDIHFEFNDGEINMQNNPDLHIMKVKSGTLRANYPYVIKPTAEADLNLVLEFEDIVLHSVNDMKKVESSSTVHTFEFAGLYKGTSCSDFAGDAPCYTITTKGEFKKIAKTVKSLPTLRVYMTIKAKDGEPVIFNETNAPEYIRMRVIGEENEDGTTTIYDVNAEEAEEMIFDLSGRRVLETEKGIYIKNGKKVYVK